VVYDKVAFFLLFYLLFLPICSLMNLRASGLGCYIFDMFVGCIMYADDIILLSGSLNDLQSMLNVCDNVSSQRLLKFNTNKCKCIAFGKMTKSATSGDGLQLDKGVVMWFDTIEYLGKRLQEAFLCCK